MTVPSKSLKFKVRNAIHGEKSLAMLSMWKLEFGALICIPDRRIFFH